MMNKLFIIGLPRTGTTSICVALLEHGFKVAHTAYTKRAFELADVIADAPCFCDYPQLDVQFPGSKFVYLDRAVNDWAPSMQRLLTKMRTQLEQTTGHFNPVIKRCFNQTFAVLSTADPVDREYLTACYLAHQQKVFSYFANRDDFLNIDVSKSNSMQMLLHFLDITAQDNAVFPRLNTGKQVDSWKEFKHPNKINPNSAGAEHRKYFDFYGL